MPLGQSQDIPQADPGGMATPRFWHRLIRFRHVISGSLALASLNHTCRNLVPTFPQRSPPLLLTTAACGGLRSTPDCRPRRALLHLSYSYASPCGPALLVTQDPQRNSSLAAGTMAFMQLRYRHVCSWHHRRITNMPSEADYVWGTGLTEQQRLLQQIELYIPEACWLLDHLNIRPASRAIDLGCGPLGILDCGFRRRRPVIPIDCGQHSDDRGQALRSTAARGS
jgi:hypothetical protein